MRHVPEDAVAVFLPRYFQQSRGLSATSSGLHIYPLMLAMVVGSGLAGWLIGRTRVYKPWLVAAPALMIAGTWLCARLAVETPFWQLASWMALIGLGMGPMLSGLAHAAAAAAVIPWLGVVGAAITVVALAVLPHERLVPRDGSGPAAA